MTALFHSTFKGGNRADASAKVVADDETDCVFAGCVWRGVFILRAKVPRRISEFRFDFIFVCLLYGYYTVYYFMSPPNSAQRYDFTGLTPNDYMDMDLSSIFGLNSRFGAVLGGIWRIFAH